MYSNEIIMLHEILFNTANIFSLLFVVTIEIRPTYKNIFNLIKNRIIEKWKLCHLYIIKAIFQLDSDYQFTKI